MDKRERKVLITAKEIIITLCTERLEMFGLTDLHAVADKIGCSEDELNSFLAGDGNLSAEQINNLAVLCNIKLSDILLRLQAEVENREREKTIAIKNPKLDPNQKDDILGILDMLDNKTKVR